MGESVNPFTAETPRSQRRKQDPGETSCKKFPPGPLQELLLVAGPPVSSPRKPAGQSMIEVFGKGSGEKPSFKKVLPSLLLLCDLSVSAVNYSGSNPIALMVSKSPTRFRAFRYCARANRTSGVFFCQRSLFAEMETGVTSTTLQIL